MEKWIGKGRLFPVKKGALRKAKSLWVERKDHTVKGEDLDVIVGTMGKILTYHETNAKVYMVAKFDDKKKKYYPKDKAAKILLQAINLKRVATEKLLAKILYTNVDEETLKRMLKKGAYFKQPPIFKDKPEGTRMYMVVGNDKKYYEV